MDNQPNNLGQTPQEEPPLTQTPEMANQLPPEPPVPPTYEPTPPERPAGPTPKKKKTWLIVLIIIIVLIVGALIASLVYWFTTLNTINEILDEENIAQIENGNRITSVDELMEAYGNQSAINCNYTITMEGETYDIEELANSGWQAHKIIAIGIDTTTTSLAINGDAVYSWGYVSSGEEFAIKMPWDKISELSDSELSSQFNTESSIYESKDSINGLVCYVFDTLTDFSIPDKEWTDIGATLDALTNESLDTLLDEYSEE